MAGTPVQRAENVLRRFVPSYDDLEILRFLKIFEIYAERFSISIRIIPGWNIKLVSPPRRSVNPTLPG